eukprot:70548-Pelagomonas_calceolata.AAC.1
MQVHGLNCCRDIGRIMTHTHKSREAKKGREGKGYIAVPAWEAKSLPSGYREKEGLQSKRLNASLFIRKGKGYIAVPAYTGSLAEAKRCL